MVKKPTNSSRASKANGADNNEIPPYELTVDLQVLKHLGIGLYSNVPAVVSEMVANAYDADAENVEITVKDDEITIKDDGLGMNVQDANKKFLTVGYDKRSSGETETPKLRPIGTYRGQVDRVAKGGRTQRCSRETPSTANLAEWDASR